MCGIFGILEHNPHVSPDRRAVEASAKLLEHRGPDHSALYCEPGIGLAHTRLSLLDPSPRSHQPFWDRSRRYGIVYNGEIYNFRELRAGLERQGVHFQTTSDTEVLIESLARDGVDSTLPKLEGMYAFALYDKECRELTLVRDRFGIKPLFIYEGANSFLFSSEIRALLPWHTHELDTLRAAGYLLGSAAFTHGFTLMKGVKSVAPGTVIRVRPSETARSSRFFSLGDLWDEDQQEELKRLGSNAVVDKVERALFAAVEMQQFSDASVGALCSGGVDSSTTVAMASRHQGSIQIFHANTPGKGSELHYALELAKHLKLDLHSVDVCDQDHIDLIPETILHRGNPFVDLPSSIPFLKLSKLVRQHGVKGVITGEASDESFWGYPHMIPNLPGKLRALPGQSYRTALQCFNRILGKQPRLQVQRVQRLGASLFTRFEVVLDVAEIRQTLSERTKKAVLPHDLQGLFEYGQNLQSLLNRNDACGMASSVESRFPYLDFKLVKLAVNLPRRHKVRFDLRTPNPSHPFMIDKWVLRRVADRYMPRALSRRFKVAWPITAQERFKIAQSLFKKSFIRDLFGFSNRELDYLTGSNDHLLKLKLLHLEVWAQLFLNGTTPERMVQKLQSCISVTPE